MLDIDRLDAQATDAEAYAQATFGMRLNLGPITPASLPHFLLDRYRLWQGTLLGKPILLAAWKYTRPGSGMTSDFLKHRQILSRELGAELVILLLDHAPAAVRRQMVERRIGFITPGVQFYVPEALLDWHERGTRPVQGPRDQVAPTTQVILLAALLGEQIDDANLTELAERFDVAVMSMSRALDELEAMKIAKARHAGRQRRLHLLYQDRHLWAQIKDRLQSPIRKVRTVRAALDDQLGPLAGESALAHHTMLAAPRIERRAVAAARWKQLAPKLTSLHPTIFDDDRIEIETWSYDPRSLAREGVVDPLSLYLSTRHHEDERVAQAAEQLLEPFGW